MGVLKNDFQLNTLGRKSGKFLGYFLRNRARFSTYFSIKKIENLRKSDRNLIKKGGSFLIDESILIIRIQFILIRRIDPFWRAGTLFIIN